MNNIIQNLNFENINKMSKKVSKNATLELKSTSNSWSKWLPFFLGLLTFLVYLNSIQNGYNLDDE